VIPVAQPRLAAAPAARTVLHASQSTFDQQVLRSEAPVLVDFYANWCGPCRALSATLEEVAAESPQAKVVKINIDESPELAARYGVNSIPSLIVFKNGQIISHRSGVVSKGQLKTMLDL
jgi:thioredoxin 1